MWGMIATWRMALEGITEASEHLEKGMEAGDAVELAVRRVEDYPFYKSVGYGGLPNENCEVELDAAFMDGNTLDIGAVAGIRDYSNPVSIARKLSYEKVNNFLVGIGAEEYAHKNGFERKNMLTDRAKLHYKKRKKETLDKGLSPYAGHDTVGMISLDKTGKMCAATSTSGLFMKKRGRIGDSALSGSGFYVDSSIGGATATGLGEDLMKGCISYEIVRLMKEGKHPQEACDIAVNELDKQLIKRRGKAGDLSLVAMNNKGEWGVATNIADFTFPVVTKEESPTVYISNRVDGKTIHKVISNEWMEAYEARIKAPIEVSE
ncbi:TPA: N(4)-(beta-N-acetylglucosaminyl)-L-asparaginase [Clostridioides difficile]|nr:N(4)-(beta-N-acetylglucosaminyl)-L-asparaginase [Clostridioides difficile]